MPAPGAPLSGLAAPLSTPPSPSPNHHAATDQRIDPASAILTVGRHARPSPRATWTVANVTFVSAGSRAIMLAAQLIGSAITAGLPAEVPASIWLNPLVNMTD